MTKPLPPRYFAVDQRLRKGLDSREIAKRLGLSQFHIASTMLRLPAKRIEFDRLLRSGAPALTVAKMWGCSRSHVENLRRELAIPHKSRKTVDYTRIDYLFEENRTNAQIIDILCRESDVPRRTLKGRVEYRRHQRAVAVADDEPREPCIPPTDRLDLALKAKARALGQPMAWMRGTWLNGQAGRNFMAQGGYL